MTILNLENYDELKEPLFLGKNLGIQSYDIVKYPQFLKMTVGAGGQWERFWRPEEIELKKDRSDYEKLTANERFIFTSNLKFQTMLDSVICRGVPAFQQYLSNKELEICMITWGFFEAIHSYSYTYIIKNIYPEPEKIFKEILLDKEIRERAKLSVSCYDGLYDVKGESEKKIKEQIYLSLIAVNILEAIRFYVSFVCAFAFAERERMSGNADIISLIRRDEALHLGITQEVLRILEREPSEGFQQTAKDCRQQAIDMFAQGAEEEKKWAQYLFKDGSLMGLNEEILSDYIEHLTDKRLHALGFDKMFGTKNPMDWLDSWMNPSSVQRAPQEIDVTNYKIGSSHNDLGDLEL